MRRIALFYYGRRRGGRRWCGGLLRVQTIQGLLRLVARSG
jgi:hypothetical protein